MKIQISLRIHSVWSESWLGAFQIARDAEFFMRTMDRELDGPAVYSVVVSTLRTHWVIMLELFARYLLTVSVFTSGILKPCISHLRPGSKAQSVASLIVDPGAASSNLNSAS